MIEKFDGEHSMFHAPVGPQFIAFQKESCTIGKLWLENPLRFEGNAEQSAQVLFEHLVRINSAYIQELEERIEELESDNCRLSAEVACHR